MGPSLGMLLVYVAWVRHVYVNVTLYAFFVPCHTLVPCQSVQI